VKSWSNPILSWASGPGIGLIVCSLATGFGYSLVAAGRPPGLALTYSSELEKVVESSGKLVALPALRRSAELDLNAEAPLWRLLNAATEAGDRKQQLFALSGLVQFDVKRADIPYQLACLYLEVPDIALASRYAAIALERDPLDPRHHCLLGATLMAQDRRLEAAREYRIALQIDPSHETALRALEGPLHGF
jgi:tetratricopeptide (TPR) repeat protein